MSEKMAAGQISDYQKNLVEKFNNEKSYPREYLLQKLYEFIKEKPEGEILDDHWLEIWPSFKQYAARYFPRSYVLEIDNAIKTIHPIDDEVWKLKIDENTKITFLMGAGSSAPSGIPTVDTLLLELWKRAKKIGRDDLDRLGNWCKVRGITNIEDLLTAAYLSNFSAKNRYITSLLDYFLFSGGETSKTVDDDMIKHRRSIIRSDAEVSSISFLQDTLQTLFGLLTSTMIAASPNNTHYSIVNFLKKHNRASIITTNYDGCMDEALLKGGKKLKTMINSLNDVSPDSIELIKMHGSINWSYCESCQEVKDFDLLDLKKMYKIDKISYPVLGICKNCGGLRRPLLVPPLSFKFLMFPNLIEIWNNAKQTIENADILIVIGYSFSEADTYITKIISRSMSKNKNQKMIIININHSIVPSLRERFSALIDDFKPDRIIQVCFDCEAILPKILDSLCESPLKRKKKIKT